jgi:tetratricopeptide (TPR) repeat protein
MSVVPKLASSRAIARLDQFIASATDPHDAACWRAERAALLARHGHPEEARAELDVLKTSPVVPRVQAWLALAEGLTAYFSDLDVTARVQLRAAYDASAAARQGRLHALAAAWLAHMDYVRHDIPNMMRYLVQALQLAATDDHAARSRACLVAALGFHHAGRFDLALPWYQATRRHAVAEGDDATLSALMHNMAWLRGNHAREASIFGGADPDEVQQALLGAESTANFDAGLGGASLQSLVPILRAQVLVVLGRYQEALALYEECLSGAIDEGLARMEGFFRADIAWCKFKSGDVSAARREARRAQLLLNDEIDVDDRACAHGRLAQLFEALGEPAGAQLHRQQADTDLAAHRAVQAELLDAMQMGLRGVTPA